MEQSCGSNIGTCNRVSQLASVVEMLCNKTLKHVCVAFHFYVLRLESAMTCIEIRLVVLLDDWSEGP